ncbi:hypothetical protein LTS08_002634 [Lithohypha guttulata]|nr:hypothetical protein LTS08_002634 [Lithohypha guttulata]
MALDLIRHNGHCFMQVAGLEISFLFKRAHRAEFFLGVEHICEHVRATRPLDEDGGWWLSTILAAERLLEIENKVPYSSTQSLEKWWAICFGGGLRDSDEDTVEEEAELSLRYPATAAWMLPTTKIAGADFSVEVLLDMYQSRQGWIKYHLEPYESTYISYRKLIVSGLKLRSLRKWKSKLDTVEVRYCLSKNKYSNIPDKYAENSEEWLCFLHGLEMAHEQAPLALGMLDISLNELKWYKRAWDMFWHMAVMVEKGVPHEGPLMSAMIVGLREMRDRQDFLKHRTYDASKYMAYLKNDPPVWLEWDIEAWDKEEADAYDSDSTIRGDEAPKKEKNEGEKWLEDLRNASIG